MKFKEFSTNFFLKPGLLRLSNSNSSLLRAVYIISHPLILLALFLYISCYFDITKPFVNLILNTDLFVWIDAKYAMQSSFSLKSTFPEVTKYFFGLWIVLTPILILFFLPRITIAEQKGWKKHWSGKSRVWQFFMIIWATLALIAAIFGFLIPGDPSVCNGCTTKSFLGLFFIYGIGCPLCIAFLISAISKLFITFIQSHISNCISGRGK